MYVCERERVQKLAKSQISTESWFGFLMNLQVVLVCQY